MFTTLDKKDKMILASAGVIILLMILYKYLKGKNQESKYVEPRGFFQNNLATPTPIAPPPVAPPPPPIMPPPPVIPPPVPPIPPVAPPVPPYPYPYGGYSYPYNNLSIGYNYGIQPYAVIDQPVLSNAAKTNYYKSVQIAGDDRPTLFSTKKDYLKFLKQSYNTLVDSYNDALYSFGWGRAIKIAKSMRKVKNDIDAEFGIA